MEFTSTKRAPKVALISIYPTLKAPKVYLFSIYPNYGITQGSSDFNLPHSEGTQWYICFQFTKTMESPKVNQAMKLPKVELDFNLPKC